MKINYFFILIIFLTISTRILSHDNSTIIDNNNEGLKNISEINIIKKTDFKSPFYLKIYAQKSILYTYKVNSKNKFVIASSLYFTPKKANSNNDNIVVFAHGTIGTNPQCSIESNLGLISQFVFIKALLKEGYKVIIPNYRGTGESNVEHIYLNAQDSAEDILNATQSIIEDNYLQNNKIILWGVSQGGIATQRAAEISSFYAPKLNIVGSIQNSPPFNIVIPHEKFKKEYLNIFQYLLLPYVVSAVVRSNNNISFNDYYKSSYLKKNERGESFKCINLLKNFLISNPYTLDPNEKGAIAMENYLNQQKVPKYKTNIPLLIIRGKKDYISKISNKNLGNDYLKLFCSQGFNISEIVRSGGHFRFKDIKYSLKWIKDRFAGKPPKNSCK